MWNTNPLTNDRDYSSSSIKTERTFDLEFYSQSNRAKEKLVISYQPKLELVYPINNVTTVTTPTFRWKKFGRNARYELYLSKDPPLEPSKEFSSFVLWEGAKSHATFGKFIIDGTYTARDHPTDESYVTDGASWVLATGEKKLDGFLDCEHLEPCDEGNPEWLKDAHYRPWADLPLSAPFPLDESTTYYWKVVATFVDPDTGDLVPSLSRESLPESFTTTQ